MEEGGTGKRRYVSSFKRIWYVYLCDNVDHSVAIDTYGREGEAAHQGFHGGLDPHLLSDEGYFLSISISF